MELLTAPLLSTRGAIVFPNQVLTVEVGRSASIEAVKYAIDNHTPLFVTSQRVENFDDDVTKGIFSSGTICSISDWNHLSDRYRIVLRGGKRARILKVREVNGVALVDYELINDYYTNDNTLQELYERAKKRYSDLYESKNKSNFVSSSFDFSMFDPSALTDHYAQIYCNDLDVKYEFLSEGNLETRLSKMIELIDKEESISNIDSRIDEIVRNNIEENQKDYYLREKLKAIREELSDAPGGDIDDLKKLVEENPYPENVKERARNEFRHYEMMQSSSAEAGILRTYLETLLYLPWYQKSVDNEDLNEAQRILDEDHYGLEKVKERILEYLAVKQMTNSLKSPIICLVGPPGVGKTSLAKSVARALNRKFVKISLGGVRDEAEIRGHRRTYIGALPGRIIQGMRRAETINPVFLIDEIDKMASDYKGDPSSAMLEVLDPEQNTAFSDHYLEEPYDLSDVLFIATANYMEGIPTELRDRLEIIELSSYTEIEKLNIAKKYLLSKQLKANGLKESQLSISDEMFLYLIRHYSREAGVRQLERIIGSICRKAVLAILKENKRHITLNKKLVNEWLGQEIYDYGTKEKKNQVGVVTGLAYTSFGGDILPVEVNYFHGKGRLVVTGQLGDVMKESTEIALDYIKANAKKYDIDPDFFDNHDIHIHVPEGAVPKDGPSAGVTITTALVSAITGKEVRADLAMTGEVTLRGNVLAIGGLREKSLAAHRSGIRTIIIPKNNTKDLKDLPESIRNDIDFISVEKVDQVIKKAIANG